MKQMFAKITDNHYHIPIGDKRIKPIQDRRVRDYIPSNQSWYYIRRCYISDNGHKILVLDTSPVSDVTHVRLEGLNIYTGTNESSIINNKIDVFTTLTNQLQAGDRVAITSWYYDRDLPIPSFGEIREVSDFRYDVTLDTPFKGAGTWQFKHGEVVKEIDFDPNMKMVSINLKEALDVLHSNKPIEHIIYDMEDLLTN